MSLNTEKLKLKQVRSGSRRYQSKEGVQARQKVRCYSKNSLNRAVREAEPPHTQLILHTAPRTHWGGVHFLSSLSLLLSSGQTHYTREKRGWTLSVCLFVCLLLLLLLMFLLPVSAPRALISAPRADFPRMTHRVGGAPRCPSDAPPL